MKRPLVGIGLAAVVACGAAALFSGCDKKNIDWGERLATAKSYRIEPGELAVVEGGDTVVYHAALGMVPDDSVIIALESVLGQTGTRPDTLIFTPTAWEQPLPVRVFALNDARSETTVVDTLRHLVETRDPDYAALARPQVTITVQDDDTPGILFSPSRLFVVETEDGSDTDSYSVWLASQPRSPVAVRFQTGDTTIVTGVSRLVFSEENWNVPQTVTVAALEDRIAEGSHQAYIEHVAASLDSAYDGLTSGFVVVEISDTDVPLLALFSPAPALREDQGPFTLTVSLNIPTTGTVAVVIALHDGLAVAGLDYVDQQTLITIPPGEMEATVEVEIIDDSLAEPVEYFYAAFVEPAFNAEIGVHDLVEFAILDDERPSISIADAVGEETEDGLVFRITVDPPPTADLPVNVFTEAGTALPNVDYVPLDIVEVSVPADSNGVDVTVLLIADDGEDSPEEFFFVDISADPELANVIDARAVGTILDAGKRDGRR